MKAFGVVRHLFYTSKIMLIVLELNHLIYKHVYCIYTMKAVVWIDTFYTSKILLIVLEQNHLIYIHVYCIYTQ